MGLFIHPSKLAIDIAGLKIATLKQVITHADLTAAATTQTIAITFPAKSYPLLGRVVVQSDFSGGAVSALTVQLGDADTDGLMTALSVFTGVANDVVLGADGVEAMWSSVEEASYSLGALFTATSDNLVNLTAGSLTAYVTYLTPQVR